MADNAADPGALVDDLTPWLEELGADHLEWDRRAEFPWSKWKTVQQTDLLKAHFAPEWGGLGHDLPTTVRLLEALGRGSRDAGLNFSISTQIVSVGIPLQRFGAYELKDRYLPRIIDGTLIGAHAITEPDHGSDALNITTTAVRDADTYVLNGSKTFITNGPIADLFVLYVRTSPQGGPLGLSTFLVERGTPGLTVGPPLEKMGLRTSPFSELFFEDLRVPAANMIGSPGSGFLVLDHVMKREILLSFGITLGEMQHRLDRCLAYAKGRTQFGRPIGSFQAVSHRIVEMKIGVETTRKWLYETAAKVAAGQDTATDIAATKIVASEANAAGALAALQIFGGHGYLTGNGIEADVRNALAGTIYSGTSEIQRNRIAALLGL